MTWAIVMMFGALVGFGVLSVRRLDALPGVLRRIARRERDDALSEMKEAVALRAGEALVAIRGYQQQLEQSLRMQIADAETRARIAERRAADTATALEAASTLVRELRGAIDGAAGLACTPGAQVSAGPPRPPVPTTQSPSEALPALPAAEDPPQRDTTEMPAPPAPPVANENDDGGGFDDGANTTVADRPAALALVRHARLIPSPSPLAAGTPRSATVLPPPPRCDARVQ